MKNELDGKIMTEFAALRVKTYSYLRDDNDEIKQKSKRTKRCVIKWILKSEVYKNCLEANKNESEIDYLKIVLKSIV